MGVRMRSFLRLALAALTAALLVAPALADDARPQLRLSTIPAHPALWKVHGPQGTAYLFGSIHILPSNVDWHTPEVTTAMAASDTFVFEIPMDAASQSTIAQFVKDNGYLPSSQSLPSLMDNETRKDYTEVLTLTRVPPDQLVDKRPWFASLVLEVGYMAQRNLSPDSGVDRQVFKEATAAGGKSFRAFETPEQQFHILMPDDPKLEMAEFDESLKELLKDKGEVGEMIDAWSHGDVKRLGTLLNSGMKADPKLEKIMFEDRNNNWVAQLTKMLGEKHTYFITVGAGHLAGPKGVPALLRAKGFKVDGP
jgi:uncharacterized protein